MQDRQLFLFDYPRATGTIRTRFGSRFVGAWISPDESIVSEALLESTVLDPTIEGRLARARRIWIKPNLTGPEPPSQGRTTSPRVLDRLLTWVKQAAPGRTEIVVADSSVIGTNTQRAAETTGVLDVCDRHDVPFVDLRGEAFTQVSVPRPLLFDTLELSTPFADTRADTLFINVGKLKSTYGSPVGFCLKNNKGLLSDDYKLAFHLKGLQKALCDLAQVTRWDLCVLEGFPMSQLGQPSPGGLLFISTDSVVVDTLACACLSVPTSDVFHIEWLAANTGVTADSFQGLNGLPLVTEGCKPLVYSVTGLAELARQYHVSILDGAPCSGCVESLAKALAKCEKGGDAANTPRIVLGSEGEAPVVSALDDLRRTVFLGNCSFDAIGMELARHGYADAILELWETGAKIPGCPPTIDEMRSVIANVIGRRGQGSKAIENRAYSREIERAFEVASPLFLSVTARSLRELAVLLPPEHHTFDDLGEEAVLGGEVICAAICHQMNWDFLRRRVYEAVKRGDDWWQARRIGQVTARTIARLLADYTHPERIRASQRAEMLRTLGVLFEHGVGSYAEALGADFPDEERPQLIVSRLSECSVFSEDPEEKKLQILLHRLAPSGLIPSVESLCQPAIDYHIVRLYLRRGDVGSRTKAGDDFMAGMQSRRSSTVTTLRRTVSEALHAVARISGLPIHTVNAAEWWVGRSVCLRSGPDCKLEGERSAWLRPTFDRCPFFDSCAAINEAPELIQITEPKHVGRFF